MASAVTSSGGSNPLGCLYQNLSTLLEEDPEKYKSFVRGCSGFGTGSPRGCCRCCW